MTPLQTWARENLQSYFVVVIPKKFLVQKNREAFHHWTCEGAVCFISPVPFRLTNDLHSTAVVLCSLDQHFCKEMKTLHFLRAQKAEWLWYRDLQLQNGLTG